MRFKVFEIFKREKPVQKMPPPDFENNWLQERYEVNVKSGVESLKRGQIIKIHEDSRGYELALKIKHEFILEYQRQLSESIIIEKSGGVTTISFHPKTF
jgi:hypothetical protein